MTDTTPALSITAEPQVIPTNCLFRVDRTLGSETLYTSDPEWAVEWAVELDKRNPRVRV